MQLYTYFRSSASYRVRIALALKGLDYESIPIHLLRDGGQQRSAAYAARNPAQLVPLLVDGALSVGQSLAIIEYLDETFPQPPLLPASSAARAWVRALALSIACDIHPLNNLRVLKYLKAPLNIDEPQRADWSRHWIALGFQSVEQLLSARERNDPCCYGEQPTLADCCLIPQVFNALRVQCDLQPFPLIRKIYEHCLSLPAFQKAAPGAQPDAE